MSNRLMDIERQLHGDRRSKATANRARPSERPRPARAKPGGQRAMVCRAFDDGSPVELLGPRRPAATPMVRSRSDAKADLVEPLETFESSPDPDVDTDLETEEDRAFAAEVQRKLQAHAARTARADAGRDRAPPPVTPAPPRFSRAKHPHDVFDGLDMSMATSFDAGDVTLDRVERAVPPRPRNADVSELDVIEDLALISATAAEAEPATPSAPPAEEFDLADGVVMPAQVVERLRSIAASYRRRRRKRLFITSGRRSPASQAQAMFVKLVGGDDLAVYRNKAAVAEIRKAYDDALAAGLDKERDANAIVERMTRVIEDQMGRGVYISKHLNAGAVDVRNRDMDSEDKAALRTSVGEVPGVSVVEETTPPHFHLQFD